MAEESGGDHAPGDGFAVLVAAVLGDAFEGMGEGVAEIENLAEAGFAFIAADDVDFDLDVARDELGKRRTIAPQNLLHIFLEHGEHRGVGNDGMLDDFGETPAKFAVGESAQQFRIGEHETGRIKGADEVLPFRQIHASFPADGAVHLCNERGGHMDECNAAEKTGRDESGDVSDDSAANGYHERSAISAGLD